MTTRRSFVLTLLALLLPSIRPSTKALWKRYRATGDSSQLPIGGRLDARWADGKRDATEALRLAYRACPDYHVLELPPGNLLLALDLPDRPIVVRGAGCGATVIQPPVPLEPLHIRLRSKIQEKDFS